MSSNKRPSEKELERRRKLSERMKGEGNPFYGKRHSQKSKETNRQKHLGKRPWNKDKPMSVEQRELLSKIRTGYKYKNPSPLKGRKRSPEVCEKIKIGHTGLKYTEYHCQRIKESKKNMPPVPEETRKRMSESAKKRGPPKLTKESYKKVSAALTGRKHSPEHCRKNGDAHRGERSGVWKGGISFLPYCYKFNDRRRKATRKFYNNTCICCGKQVTENIVGNKQTELSVHHIDHDKDQGCNGKPFNLVPLCQACHAKEMWNEKEYRDYINKTLREGFKWGIWNEREYIRLVMYDE
jgi:hypothetical protein